MSSDTEKLIDTQVGGNYYQKLDPQPIEVILRWRLPFCIGNVVKYLARYKFKNGIEDLKKAQQYLRFEMDMAHRSLSQKMSGYIPGPGHIRDNFKFIDTWKLSPHIKSAIFHIGRGNLELAGLAIELEIQLLEGCKEEK